MFTDITVAQFKATSANIFISADIDHNFFPNINLVDLSLHSIKQTNKKDLID